MKLIYLLITVLPCLVICLGKNDFYFITVPNFLMTESPHQLNVQTSTDLVMVIETIHPTSQFKNTSSVYLIKKGFQSISYYVPFVGAHVGSEMKLTFRGDICQDIVKCQTSKIVGDFINETYEIGLIDKNFIIFGETDKPIYKPGEKVKFRFMPIYPTNLMREPEDVGTQYEIILNKDNKFEMNKINYKNMSRMFDLITIETPDGVRLSEWRNLSLENAMNLEHQLMKDTVFGQWKIKAIFAAQEEIIKFTVKRYVLPRFVVDVFPPTEILVTDKSIKFKICAKYSTGKKMNALIHGEFCVVYNNFGNQNTCQKFKRELRKKSCATISLESKSLNDTSENRWNYGSSKTIINVTVVENETTSEVRKFVESVGIKTTPYNIKFESKSYFKPGLPYFGKVRLERHNKKPKKNTTVTIRVDGWYYLDNWGFQQNYTSDKTGMIDFIIPYIPVQRSFTLQVVGVSGKIKYPMSQPMAQQQLSNWESVDNQFLQISPIKSSIECPGHLNLTILTNGDISVNDMYVQIFSRGQVTDMFEYPPVPVKCAARDDFLGHYNCIDGNTLICLPGWKGGNCREPICKEGCINGACIESNKCICKMGWAGESCETCILANYCKNGYCKYGNDCQCFSGWIEYDCSRKGPKVHPLITYPPRPQPTIKPSVLKEKENQTIFERIINIPLLKYMGPDLHIIVYFINSNKEVVADAIEISKGLNNCSHLGGGEFKFNKEKSIPKANVILTIDPVIKNSSCAVRIGDVALSQFGESSNVDLLYLVQKLIAINHKITVDSRRRSENQRICVPVFRVKRMIWPGYNRGFDTRMILAKSGLTAITNTRIVNVKCRLFYASPRESVAFQLPAMDTFSIRKESSLPLGTSKSKMQLKDTAKAQLKKQIRDFFPESWIFTYFNQTNNNLNLTVPDSMTTWKADSYCMTQKGLWIAPSQKLLVILPFFADVYVPYSIKLDEKFKLPVKLFNYANDCYEIYVQVNVDDNEIKIIGLKSFTLCVCSNDEKTVYFDIKPKIIGKLNITIFAESKYSSFCSSNKKNKSVIEMQDSIRRQLLVEPSGVPTETTFSELICNKNEEFGIVDVFTIPSVIVSGSLRSYLTFNGDVMGQTFDNLDKLVTVPYGCGEQNMVAVVPSIYILQYLSGMKINKPALASKAREYINIGYTRQMNYKHDDGSFSAFGKTDKAGSTWLTAFVLRSFTDASKYVTIDKTLLTAAINYLKKMQLPNGCFKENGKLFSSIMAGGVQKSGSTCPMLLTSYVLISLQNIENAATLFDLPKAVKCVQSSLNANSSNYRLALSGYALSLYEPNSKITLSFLDQLIKRSVKYGRYQYWPNEKDSSENQLFNAADVETTGYAFLALQNHQTLSDSLKTVYWLSNQRNSLGGYYSTQDTIIALNALAVFAEKIGVSEVVNLNVSIVLNNKMVYNDLMTAENRLLSRVFHLGTENISYISIKTNGSGCVSVQLNSLYNIEKLYSAYETFKVSVKTKAPSEKKCNTRQVKICFSYLRRDKNSNMVLVTIDYPSGWQLSEDEMENLKKQIATPLNRIDFQINKMELYYDSFSYNDAEKEICFNFQLEMKTKVSNLKPAFVRIVDYYDPAIYTDTSYSMFDSICNKSIEKIPVSPNLLLCPKCVNESESSTMEFIKTICQSWFGGLVMADKRNSTKDRIVYQAKQSVFYEMQVDLEPWNCSCLKTWSEFHDNFVILSKWLYLSEKMILSNDTTMFPFDTLYSAYKYDLSRQCSVATNMYQMVGRIMPSFINKTAKNDSCPVCILRNNYYSSIKNLTSWFCANYTEWKLDISSVSPIIKGVINGTNNSVSIQVELEFPNNQCYCHHQMVDMKKSFRIVDVNNTIKADGNKPVKSMKLVLNHYFEIIEEEVYKSFSHIKC